jgi:hypothetical protein
MDRDIAMNKNKQETTCNCGRCFYCYIHQDRFHTANLSQLRTPPLHIDVAEYVGPEVATPTQWPSSPRFILIPIESTAFIHNNKSKKK